MSGSEPNDREEMESTLILETFKAHLGKTTEEENVPPAAAILANPMPVRLRPEP
jgi:hypothetical protein